MPTTFHLIRHGRTVWNEEGRAQGHADSPLTDDAIYQTQQKAEELAKHRFAAIYSSDLGRTQQTARILSQHHPSVPIKTHPHLRERGFGRYEGRPFSEYDQFYQARLAEYLCVNQNQKPDFHHWQPDPTFETGHQVATRVINHLQQLSGQHRNQEVLIVTHGGVLSSVLVELQHAAFKSLFGKVKNLSRVILEEKRKRFAVTATPDIDIIT